MLMAPFAGPAMNIAIASARGEAKLLQRSLLRVLADPITFLGVVDAAFKAHKRK